MQMSLSAWLTLPGVKQAINHQHSFYGMGFDKIHCCKELASLLSNAYSPGIRIARIHWTSFPQQHVHYGDWWVLLKTMKKSLTQREYRTDHLATLLQADLCFTIQYNKCTEMDRNVQKCKLFMCRMMMHQRRMSFKSSSPFRIAGSL
jgi:hypothetical protein